MGPTWGPSGADRTQVGPMLAPWTLLSGMLSREKKLVIIFTWKGSCDVFGWIYLERWSYSEWRHSYWLSEIRFCVLICSKNANVFVIDKVFRCRIQNLCAFCLASLAINDLKWYCVDHTTLFRPPGKPFFGSKNLFFPISVKSLFSLFFFLWPLNLP